MSQEDEYLTMACPYCGWEGARSMREEVAHMNADHPDIIEDRLRRAGVLPPPEIEGTHRNGRNT